MQSNLELTLTAGLQVFSSNCQGYTNMNLFIIRSCVLYSQLCELSQNIFEHYNHLHCYLALTSK